jgi:hypothetical protein
MNIAPSSTASFALTVRSHLCVGLCIQNLFQIVAAQVLRFSQPWIIKFLCNTVQWSTNCTYPHKRWTPPPTILISQENLYIYIGQVFVLHGVATLNILTVTILVVTLQHFAQCTCHCQHWSIEQQLSSLHDLPSTRLVFCSIHTVWHTSLSF